MQIAWCGRGQVKAIAAADKAAGILAARIDRDATAAIDLAAHDGRGGDADQRKQCIAVIRTEKVCQEPAHCGQQIIICIFQTVSGAAQRTHPTNRTDACPAADAVAAAMDRKRTGNGLTIFICLLHIDSAVDRVAVGQRAGKTADVIAARNTQIVRRQLDRTVEEQTLWLAHTNQFHTET